MNKAQCVLCFSLNKTLTQMAASWIVAGNLLTLAAYQPMVKARTILQNKSEIE